MNKKELKKKKSFSSFPIQRNTVVPLSKPIMYKRVDEEKQRLRIGRTIQVRKEMRMKRKYFNRLKFYHRVIQLRKRIKLSYKVTSFWFLRDYYYSKQEKYKGIINYFDKLRKIKIFALLYKEKTLESNKNSFLKRTLTKNFNFFIDTVSTKIYTKFRLFNLTEKLYLRNFVRKVFAQRELHKLINKSKAHLKKNFEKNRKKKFFDIALKEYHLDSSVFFFRSRSSFLSFFSVMKKISSFNHSIYRRIYVFIIKHSLEGIYKNIKEGKKEKQKSLFARMFYSENLEKRLISYLKRHLYLIKKFRKMMTRKINQKKEIIVKQIKGEAKKMSNIKKTYREYKRKKIVPYKQFLFDFVRFKINLNHKKFIALKHYYENLIKKSYISLSKYVIRMKNFKIFLYQLRKVHNQVLMKNYLDLMQYKVHKFIDSPVLPRLVSIHLLKNFDNIILKLECKKMRSFFRACKKTIRSKKNYKIQLQLANERYSKKQMFKIFEGMKKFLIYSKIHKKYKKLLIKKYIQMLKGRQKKFDFGLKSFGS